MNPTPIFAAFYRCNDIPGKHLVLLEIDGETGRLVVVSDVDMVKIYDGWDLEEAIQFVQSLAPNITASEIRTSFAKWYNHRNSTHRSDRDKVRNDRISSRTKEVLSLLIMS